jgi:two-component system sensor histidine kinase ChiS
MGGFEVCRRLREDPNLQTVPIIFLTALDDEDSRLTGLEMMGDDYFTKPIKSNLLIKKISSTLRLNQMRSQQQERRIEEQVKKKLRGKYQLHGRLINIFQRSCGYLCQINS